ncbi:uncharacterized protein LOC128552120, partial [Mercenaria mercenaria]|uniref:uncharacterized protein LOC128552120 n=1 Tax=Mercenaria mercenaria TaxID=6596 RepID=UPI00234E82B9
MANWKLYASSAGTVTTMLWRHTSSNNYKLESMEDHAVLAGQLNTPFPLTTLQVQIGDVVGWKTGGAELIPNSATASAGTRNQPLNAVLNAEVPWGGTLDTASTYAFGAVVAENDLPTITGGSETITDTATSQTVHTLAITDTDSLNFLGDTVVGITSTSPATTEFSIGNDGTDFVINSGASLTVGTYELEVTVEDACEVKVSATVTITVQNPAPVYDPSTPDTSYSGTISDDTTTATSIYSFLVVDTDPVTCTVDNTNFEIRDAPPNKEIWLKDVATTDLHYDDTAVEGMGISCTDGSTAALRTYTVNITDALPVLSDLGVTTNVGDGAASGTSVYQFTVDDQDDVVTCTSSDPDFTVNSVDGVAGTQRFDIETAVVLDAATTPSYSLTLSCLDGVNAAVTDTLTITVSDTAPVFDPATPDTSYTGTISDDTTIATSLYAFSVIDTNAVTCTTDNSKFEIRDVPPNQEIWLKDVAATDLNFDNNAEENMTISCDDSTTTITRTFSVDISDAPPTLSNLGGATTGPIGDLTTAIGTTIYQFTATDQDDPVTCTSSDGNFTITNDSPGAVGTQVLNIVTAAALNEDTTASFSLTLTCLDGVNAAVTDTLIVTVSDDQPTLTGLDVTSAALPDGVQAAEPTLVSFTVTDANDVAGITCSITAPNDVLFQLTGTAPNIDVKPITGTTLEAASAPYEVEILCDDDEAANTVSGTVTVPVTNVAPVFVDMPATLSPAISDATDVDTLLHSFSVTDSPTATITCSYTAAAPYDDDFDIQGTPPDFEIWLLAANDLHYDANSTVPVTVTCTDTFTSITEDFTVDIYDEDPVWTGFPAATYQYLSDGGASAVSLYLFSVADSDDTMLCAVDQTSPEATHFEIRPLTPPEFELWYQGSPPATLDYTAASSHDVSIICNDSALYTHTEVFTVDLENSPPTFTNLPNASPTISESETTKTSLFTVSVSDNTEAYCYLSDTVIAAGIEPLEKGTVALPITEYVVYAWHTTGFDFEGRSGTITVDVSCGDTVSTITETLTINIQNSAPVITNPGGSYTVSEEETGTLTMKTINFEKFDADDAACTMTNADGGPFDVTNNQIVKTAAGVLDYETKDAYSLVVSCTDGVLTTTDTFTVNVENKGPDITNLPSAIEIPEQQVDRLQLLGLTLSEDAVDCSQVAPVEPEFEVLYEPSTSLWTIYYVGQAVAGKSLKYETTPYYDINIVCTDTLSGAQGKQKTYTVSVIDNEAPVFDNIG